MRKLHIGLDFDNTIVLYDEIFYHYALEKNYIDGNVPKTKKAVRNELIKKNREALFTEMQGIVYGKLIKDAPLQKGFIDSLVRLSQIECKISIVSHKTKHPIIGEKFNLHESALNWLKSNKVLGNNLFTIKEKNVFFEESEEKKINRIKDIGCTHYVDDLEKILFQLPKNIVKIHFVNETSLDKSSLVNKDFFYLNNWTKFNNLIEMTI
tara:strand:- start:17 stop:643 length:627 start_codon:yes stop_codon:yes gene_type:complete